MSILQLDEAVPEGQQGPPWSYRVREGPVRWEKGAIWAHLAAESVYDSLKFHIRQVDACTGPYLGSLTRGRLLAIVVRDYARREKGNIFWRSPPA